MAQLDRQTNLWNDIRDFGWLHPDRPSPNWAVLPFEDRIEFSSYFAAPSNPVNEEALEACLEGPHFITSPSSRDISRESIPRDLAAEDSESSDRPCSGSRKHLSSAANKLYKEALTLSREASMEQLP